MRSSTLFAFLMLLSDVALCDPVNMKPGLWKFSGPMGSGQTICYSASDLASLPVMLEAAAKKGGTSCKWSDIKGAGNVWTYTQACSYGGGAAQTSSVKNSFNGETAEMVISGNGYAMTSNGKWVAACQ